MKQAYIALILFLLVLVSTPGVAFAGEPNIEEFDDYLANALGTTQFVGGLLATIIFFAWIVFPISFIARRNKGATGMWPEIAGVILVLCLGVALGWIHYWVLLLFSLVVAGIYAGMAQGMFGGDKK